MYVEEFFMKQVDIHLFCVCNNCFTFVRFVRLPLCQELE